MGKTSKPLYIQISADIYKTAEQMWADLTTQGHTVQILQYEEYIPDIILAPNAMRMTPAMLVEMPSALKLAIEGSRLLRYAPHGKGVEKGKPKVAKGKKPHKGKYAEVKTEAIDSPAPDSGTGEQTPTHENRGVDITTNKRIT